MEITQTRMVPAAPERVWAALMDPEVLKACIPGCESFERTTARTPTVPPSPRRSVRSRHASPASWSWPTWTPPNGYTLKFEGQGGAAGFANGEREGRRWRPAEAARRR